MNGYDMAEVRSLLAKDLEIESGDYWLHNQSDSALIELAEEQGIIAHGVIADDLEVGPFYD